MTRSSLGRATVGKESVNNMAEMYLAGLRGISVSPDRTRVARMGGIPQTLFY